MSSCYFDPLDHFLMWYLHHKPVCPPNGEIINNDGRVIETILFRQDQFQVQQCVVLGDTELPDHVHPEVDSFEVYVAGDITFRANGDEFTPGTPMTDHLRIKPFTAHGGSFGKRGGVFLSVQHWLDDTFPTFISKNWEFAEDKETRRNHD